MALPKQYTRQPGSLARSLEVVGERWTLLIIRDAFYGARRFGDFVGHLGIPRAVLTNRLLHLVEHGVFAKALASGSGYAEYELTSKGRQLWTVIYGLIRWGDEHYADAGAPRVFEHAADGGRIDAYSRCARCGQSVDVHDIQAVPGPGFVPPESQDALTVAMLQPRRLLEPLRKL
ncbi:winged helix-turn-helix transcriptional regulator [Streptomyces chartreusis]|uniref:winged helix-turn-helix transcriptional regulator n=1 Tax=Streptomyces chartreusis TaxID=1969 RepID=UPI003D8AACB8